MDLTLLVKSLESGQYEASVLEMPEYRVTAESKESALDELKTTLLQQIQDAEALSGEPLVSPAEEEPAWLKFAGIFENNADFAEIITEIQKAKEVWGDEEMDESEYSR